MSAVGWRKDDFGPDTQLLLVSFSDPGELREYAKHRNLPFQVLHDENQDIYRQYGLEKGTFRNLWGFSSMLRYAKIIVREGFSEVRKPIDDWEQLGGDFVIAPDGTLSYGHWSSGPGNRPEIDQMVEAVALASYGT